MEMEIGDWGCMTLRGCDWWGAVALGGGGGARGEG